MNSAAGIAARRVAQRDRRQLFLWSYTLAALAAVTVSVAVALSGARANPGLVALARGSMIAIPLAVGLNAWYHGRRERFAGLLVAAGFALFVTTLAE